MKVDLVARIRMIGKVSEQAGKAFATLDLCTAEKAVGLIGLITRQIEVRMQKIKQEEIST